MQSTASTSMEVAPPEDVDDSIWSSLWLSGWDNWAEAYLTEERSAEVTQLQSATGRRTRSVRRPRHATAHVHARADNTPSGHPDAHPGTPSDPNSTSPEPGTVPATSKSDDEHICTVCNKSLSSLNALKLHSKTHNGGRPWKCEECEACFARKDHLRVHYRVHTGERPYSCMICGNSFAHSGTLKSHIRTHTGEKPFACDACGICFSDPSTLRMHRLKHADVKSFVCNVCGRAFASNGILNKHRRIHPNGACVLKAKRATMRRNAPSKQCIEEQLFPCDECGRLFKSERYLSLHMRSHPVRESRSRDSQQLEDSSSQQLEVDVPGGTLDTRSDEFQDGSSFTEQTTIGNESQIV